MQKWKGRHGLDPLHRLDGWRLGLDGERYLTGVVAGVETRDGAYPFYLASQP